MEIDGGAAAVEVRRVDRFAYGEPSEERRTAEGGTLSIGSRCPDQVLGACRASYRLTVPDNVPIEIETSSGSVRASGVRATVADQHRLGRDLRDRLLRLLAARQLGVAATSPRPPSARPTGSSCARAAATCARSCRPAATRSTRRATPASSRIRGLTDVEDAPFQIQALSTSGDVTVEADALTAALDVSPHLRAARRALLYLIVGLGQGLTYLLLVGGGLVLGVLLTPLWVGLPILAGTARLTWRLAEGERRQANRLLETHLPPVPPPPPGSGLRELFGTRALWRVLAMLLLKLPLRCSGSRRARARRAHGRARRRSGSAGWPATTAGSSGRGRSARRSGSRCACSRSRPRSSRSPRSRASAPRCARSPAAVLRPRAAEGGPVRELLAERLGDRSLNIAYWLPEREIFVDETGRKVELPDPGSGRAWTAVEHAACGWPRSSTTPSSMPRRSWSAPPA